MHSSSEQPRPEHAQHLTFAFSHPQHQQQQQPAPPPWPLSCAKPCPSLHFLTRSISNSSSLPLLLGHFLAQSLVLLCIFSPAASATAAACPSSLATFLRKALSFFAAIFLATGILARASFLSPFSAAFCEFLRAA